MNKIEELADLFKRFPGIGPRQSKRFVYFLLRQDKIYSKKLISLIQALKEETSVCKKCQRFFTDPKSLNLCEICRNQNRDFTSLMIVEKDVDLENVERSGIFKGLYFVLGGNIPLTDDDGGETIRESKLLERINSSKEDLKEIVIATNATTEGDHTREYLDLILTPLSNKVGFKITHLGRGLSTGTELEYSDKDTLRNAFENRN